MPLLIAVSHQKGGVGKSTLTLALASYFAEQGSSVGVADMDKQGTISNLFDELEAYKDAKFQLLPNFKMKDVELYPQLDVIFIDTPPYLSKDLSEIFSNVDFVLIPTKPALPDVLAIRATIDIFKTALADNPTLKCGVILNMTTPNTSYDFIRQRLAEFGAHILKTEILKRVSFERCLATPETIFGLSDKKAVTEIESLAEEIVELIKQAV
jgi:chromosome partitioning protein